MNTFHAAKGATEREVRTGGFDAAKPLCGLSLATVFGNAGLRTAPHVEGRAYVTCPACLAAIAAIMGSR